MEDSGFSYTASEERLLARFPCNSASSSVRRTPSSKRLEPPRETLNLSPEPVPKKVIFDHRAAPAEVRGQECRQARVSRAPQQAHPPREQAHLWSNIRLL